MIDNRIRIIKGIAPSTMLVNGRQSPCECTERITCAYCVQASLLYYAKQSRPDDEALAELKNLIKRKGLRRMARLLGVEHKSLSNWIKKEKLPPGLIAKLKAA